MVLSVLRITRSPSSLFILNSSIKLRPFHWSLAQQAEALIHLLWTDEVLRSKYIEILPNYPKYNSCSAMGYMGLEGLSPMCLLPVR